MSKLQAADALASAIEGKGDPEYAEITVIANLLCDFWIPNQIGIGHAAKEIGCTSMFSAPPNGNLDEQIEIIQDAINKDYSGIAVSPLDAVAMEPLIEEAITNDIKVITFDSDGIAESQRQLYLGTINKSAGRQAGKEMARLLNNQGKVAVFAGVFTGDNNASERYDGIQEAFNGTEIELLPPYEDNVDFTVAYNNVEQAIATHADLSGIITIWAYNGPEAARAIQALGKEDEIKIVAFDMEPETIAFLDEGIISAAVAQRPYWMGYLSVYILYSMDVLGAEQTKNILSPWLTGDNDDIFDTGIDLVTSDNLEIYRDYLELLGISSS